MDLVVMFYICKFNIGMELCKVFGVVFRNVVNYDFGCFDWIVILSEMIDLLIVVIWLVLCDLKFDID